MAQRTPRRVELPPLLYFTAPEIAAPGFGQWIGRALRLCAMREQVAELDGEVVEEERGRVAGPARLGETVQQLLHFQRL